MVRFGRALSPFLRGVPSERVNGHGEHRRRDFRCGKDDRYPMLKYADEAPYQAKSEGRNRTVAHQATSATS